MGKRGGPKHLKRIAAPKPVPIHDKKESVWMIRPNPGPHAKLHAIPLGMLLRDILKLAKTKKEVRRILSNREVQVDGKVRVDEKFPVGLMDVISFPKSGKNYRLALDNKGRLVPEEAKKEEAGLKTLKVIKKHTISKGKINITFHDGRNMVGDNHIMVGDSIVISIPKTELKSHLKREKGAKCLVMDGKHAGSIVALKEVIQRKGGKPSEALVQQDKEEFITVAKYLFVIEG
jgi:small subunit ribosomal protein S4e